MFLHGFHPFSSAFPEARSLHKLPSHILLSTFEKKHHGKAGNCSPNAAPTAVISPDVSCLTSEQHTKALQLSFIIGRDWAVRVAWHLATLPGDLKGEGSSQTPNSQRSYHLLQKFVARGVTWTSLHGRIVSVCLHTDKLCGTYPAPLDRMTMM